MTDARHVMFTEIQTMLVQLKDNGIIDEADPLLTQSFIEGETVMPDLIAAVIRSIDEDQVLVAGLKTLIDEYQARKSRFDQRIENKRGLIELALMRADIRTLETSAATVSLRPIPAALGPVDEALIPSEYFTVPAPSLDRRKLLAALKEGKHVAGAALSNGGQSIAIRRH